jgi:hypothetical protein
MTEENTAQPTGRLVTIAQIAAENIARVLELPETAVVPLQEAIGDEIAAMSTHFAFTINDLHAQWEKAEGKLTRIRAILDDEPTQKMGTLDLVEVPAAQAEG